VLSSPASLHLLVRLDPETVKNWSDEEVIRRWAWLFPPRDKMRRPLKVSDDWVKGHRRSAAWIKRARERLASLSWFMKCLDEDASQRGWFASERSILRRITRRNLRRTKSSLDARPTLFSADIPRSVRRELPDHPGLIDPSEVRLVTEPWFGFNHSTIDGVASCDQRPSRETDAWKSS
jgi:hypothetical protein